jgi:flavin-dependent dehydrogenase
MFAADGLYSPIRKRLGLEAPAKRKPRLGIRRHYPIKPWSSFVEVYWSEHAEAYVTPVSDQLVGVAILYYKDKAPPHQNKYEHLLSLFPTLKEKLNVNPSTTLRGSGPFERRTKSPVRNRILLVGDSAGYLDPLTGEGIRMGLDSAQAALRCIIHDQPSRYHKEWKSVTRRYWWMTGGLLRIREVPVLRKLMIPTLKRSPWLFGHIVSALAEA